MYGVIVTAHGNLPTGLKSGLKLVNGEMENVRYCDFLEENTSDDIAKKIQEALNKLLTKYEGVFILTDIMGGTPFNQSVLLSQNLKNVKVLGGVNFSMLYSAATSEGNMEVVLADIISDSKEVIGYFGQDDNVYQNEEDNLFSDGI